MDPQASGGDGKSRKRKSVSPARNESSSSSQSSRNSFFKTHDREYVNSRDAPPGPSRPPQNNAPPQNGSSANSAAPGQRPNPPSNTNFEKYKSLSDITYPFMTDFSEYERCGKIGQGTFGEVFKAKCKKTNRTVALKKILMENEKEGFPITALREIKILYAFDNENVVKLLDICSSKASNFNRYKSTFYLVFEFCEHDLAGLLSNKAVKFKEGETKKLMQQLLNGLFYIHTGKVLHRDMKTSNILINRDGILKIADFGLARAFSHLGTKEKPNRFTNRVVTLWYRPPELLLGERNYTPAIDIWGAGCIMCELWTRSPILQGQNEQHQLQLIGTFCGSITPEVYPDIVNLEPAKHLSLPQNIKRDVKKSLEKHIKDPLALDLLDKIFVVDPSKRLDADGALNHDYFWEDPMPQDLAPKMRSLTQSNFEFTASASRQTQQANAPAHPPHPHPAPGNRAPVHNLNHGRPDAGVKGFFADRVF
ncbi:hypothetical protein RvY_19101 [Ramazzottius varieornatus]|uniref:Protein kinase domain-containing protein n=1 Tax=Ramazzottius varieornatus TaxID=947166 RepID=A0A1D1W889_RAMVA|nr:hypothetical protein RvY_19101 [Ramazzottius varieornatus]